MEPVLAPSPDSLSCELNEEAERREIERREAERRKIERREAERRRREMREERLEGG